MSRGADMRMHKKISAGADRVLSFLARDNKKILLILFALFLLMRVGTALFLGQKITAANDSMAYHRYAQTIAESSSWLTSADFEGSERAPGYPLFIAAVYFLFGENNVTAVYIFQALLNVLTCLYIYKLSSRVFDKRAAFLSFVWSGLYVFYFYYMGFLLRETLIFFLIIVFFYYLYLTMTDEEKRSKNFWLFSASYIFLVHTDARYLFYLPFLLILFIRYRPFFRGIKEYLLFLAAFVLMLVPWTVRNIAAYDGFVLINTRTLDLRPKNERSPKPLSRFSDQILNFKRITETKRSVYPTEKERIMIKQGLNPHNRSKEEIAAVKKDVYPPSGFVERKLFWMAELWRPVRFSYYYTPFPDAKFQPRWTWPHNLSSLLSYGILLPFMMLGGFFLIKRKNKDALFLFFPILLQTLLHVLHCGVWRYRVPVDGFIIMIALYGVVQTLSHTVGSPQKEHD